MQDQRGPDDAAPDVEGTLAKTPAGDSLERDSSAITPRRRPRLQDIAATTGLSIKTVSRALRGEHNVSQPTRQLVLAEADRIGFRMNDVAAGLRRKTQSMTTIGVLLGDFANPFFAPMLQGIHSVTSEHGYLVLTADAQNDPQLEHQAIRSFFAHRVAGLIIAPIGIDLGYLENEAAFGTAIVFVDSPPPGLDGRMDSVTTTNVASTRDGIDHLISRGRKRIAYLGHPRGGSGAEERWAGYTSALAAAGIKLDGSLVRHGLVTEDDASKAADEVCTLAHPDAFFVDNTRLCMGLLRSRRFAEHRMDVVSFDRFALAPEFGVSVIDSDPYAVGRVGAELLFKRLANGDLPPQQAEVPATFITNDHPLY